MHGTSQGLILFAHGARDPRWAEPFERTAQQLRQLRPDAQVALAYLEFMSPDLPSCGDELVAAGCRRVDVLPLFLGTGGHVRRDLPAQVDGLRARHPEVDWYLHVAAGESPALVTALAQWAAAASRPLVDASP